MVGLPVGLEDIEGFPVGVGDGTLVGAGLTLGSDSGSSYRIFIFPLNAIPNSEVIISPNTVSISATEGIPGGAPSLQWHFASPSISSTSMRCSFSTALSPESTLFCFARWNSGELSGGSETWNDFDGEDNIWRSRSVG